MTINEQIKIYGNKIRSNQAQYDLDRQNAKISALSSGKLDRYEYLTGEDLGYISDVVQKTKFEYSPLGQVFNKGLDSSEKQEGFLKRLKNIEDKTDKQLNENKDSQLGIKSIGYTVKEELSQEAKNMLEKLNNQEKLINYRKLNFTRGNKVDYDFSEYRSLKELFKAIYYRNITIEKVERIQEEFNSIIDALKNYKPKKQKYKENKEKLLNNAQNFYDGREMIINAFKNEIFPLVPSGYTSDDDDKGLPPDSPTSSFSTTDKSNKSDESNEFDFTADDFDEMCIGNADDLDKLLLDTEKYLDLDLIEKYFFNRSLKKISAFLKHKKDTSYGKIEVALIKNRLEDLKIDIKYMPKNEVKNKKEINVSTYPIYLFIYLLSVLHSLSRNCF